MRTNTMTPAVADAISAQNMFWNRADLAVDKLGGLSKKALLEALEQATLVAGKGGSLDDLRKALFNMNNAPSLLGAPAYEREGRGGFLDLAEQAYRVETRVCRANGGKSR